MSEVVLGIDDGLPAEKDDSHEKQAKSRRSEGRGEDAVDGGRWSISTKSRRTSTERESDQGDTQVSRKSTRTQRFTENVAAGLRRVMTRMPRRSGTGSVMEQVSSFRQDFGIASTQDLRNEFAEFFTGESTRNMRKESSESSARTWGGFFCHLGYSFMLSVGLASLMAVIHLLQSVMILFPPVFMADATILGLVLPPLTFWMLHIPAVSVFCLYFRSMEEEKLQAWRTFRLVAFRTVVCYTLFVSVRLALRSANVTPFTACLVEVFMTPVMISGDAHATMFYAARRRRHGWTSCFFAWLRGNLVFVYVVGLVATLALNFFVFPGTPLDKYMGFILVVEKQCLRLLANFSLQVGPCGFPEFLLSLGAHFEVDTHMMSALGIAGASTPMVVLQSMCLDAILFIANCEKLLMGQPSLTLDQIDKMWWIKRIYKKVALRFSGYALLYPKHLYVGKAIYIMMDNMAQICASLYILVVLWVVTLVRADGRPLKILKYFLPHGNVGILYVGLKALFALFQSLVYYTLLLNKRMKVTDFLTIHTYGFRATLWHAVTWSFSAWILVMIAFIGWWATRND